MRRTTTMVRSRIRVGMSTHEPCLIMSTLNTRRRAIVLEERPSKGCQAWRRARHGHSLAD